MLEQKTRIGAVGKLNLRNGSLVHRSEPNAKAHNALFAQWSVKHAVRAKLFAQVARAAKHAAKRNVFAKHARRGVGGQRNAQRIVASAISPNERLEYVLHPWTSYLIVPTFALANAGIQLNAHFLSRAVDSH